MDVIHSDTLVKVIKDVLQRLNLSQNKVRGQCYDGASTMAGVKSGVSTKFLSEEPRALYTHCYGHALNLACADTVKQCKLIRDALDTTFELTKLSPKRDARLQQLKAEAAIELPGIHILCPTRWTVRADTLLSVMKNYTVLLDMWTDSLISVKDTDMRARIIGVSAQMETFDFSSGSL